MHLVLVLGPREMSYSSLLFVGLGLGCLPPLFTTLIAGSFIAAYSLIWGSHKIWGKGGGDTLALL